MVKDRLHVRLVAHRETGHRARVAGQGWSLEHIKREQRHLRLAQKRLSVLHATQIDASSNSSTANTLCRALVTIVFSVLSLSVVPR